MDGYIFGPEDVARIGAAVRADEAKVKRPIARRDAPPRIVQPDRNAYTTSVITAKSGLNLGYGTGALYYRDATSGPPYTLKFLVDDVTFINPSITPVAAGMWVKVSVVDGMYEIYWEDCGAIPGSAYPPGKPTTPESPRDHLVTPSLDGFLSFGLGTG